MHALSLSIDAIHEDYDFRTAPPPAPKDHTWSFRRTTISGTGFHIRTPFLSLVLTPSHLVS
jgi:hypothetical protein